MKKGVSFLLFISPKLEASENYMDQLVITTVDLDKASDGTFRGMADSGIVKAEVEVLLENQAIQQVTLLEHRHSQGKAAEAILDTIRKEQSLDVDTVTGATVSSKIILKSTENALQKALD